MPSKAHRLLVSFSLTLVLAASNASPANEDVAVKVTHAGDIVRVHADFLVAVSPTQAFAVLTDYDHMRDFLPDVVESKVIQRSSDKLLVSQSLTLRVGFLSVPLDSVRLVELKPPFRLVSHALSGTISKAEVTTTLTDVQGKTLVSYESQATLNSWLPAALGTTIIAGHVREQLTSMRTEMLRRYPSTTAIPSTAGEAKAPSHGLDADATSGR